MGVNPDLYFDWPKNSTKDYKLIGAHLTRPGRIVNHVEK